MEGFFAEKRDDQSFEEMKRSSVEDLVKEKEREGGFICSKERRSES